MAKIWYVAFLVIDVKSKCIFSVNNVKVNFQKHKNIIFIQIQNIHKEVFDSLMKEAEGW